MKNNIRIFLFAILTVSCLTASAQRGLKLGGFIMPQYVTMRNPDDKSLQIENDDNFRYAPLYGISFGAQLGYNPSENFGIKTGVAYSHQGYKWTSKHTFRDRYKHITRLNYLKIPFMLGLHTNYTDNKAVFSFYGGYQLGILLGGQQYDDVWEYSPATPYNISKYPVSMGRIYNRTNHMIVGDMGLDIKMTESVAFNLHVRADYSFGDAENKQAQIRVTSNGSTTYNRYWGLGRLDTHNFNAGLLFGVTYNIIPVLKVEKPKPTPRPAQPKKVEIAPTESGN